MSGKIVIILNPVAGHGTAVKEYPRIEQFLKGKGEDFEILLTQAPGDALEIARTYPLDKDTLAVAAGGDGTCNEVVNGLLTRAEAPAEPPLFGVLPIGRGNDFAYSARVPHNLEQALEIMVGRHHSPLDAGRVQGGNFPQGRYFVNGLGIGFDTRVGFEAARMKHVHSGIAYTLGALITMIRHEQSPLLELTFNGKTITSKALIVSLMNGKRLGGSFFMGPNASLEDGKLDICMAEHRPRRKIPRLIIHYTRGTQRECEGVLEDRSAVYHLKTIRGGIAAHCDGETVCEEGAELDVQCFQGMLRLVGPV
jgi:YegS/Rv2252/BmrU family lipid kinase